MNDENLLPSFLKLGKTFNISHLLNQEWQYFSNVHTPCYLKHKIMINNFLTFSIFNVINVTIMLKLINVKQSSSSPVACYYVCTFASFFKGVLCTKEQNDLRHVSNRVTPQKLQEFPPGSGCILHFAIICICRDYVRKFSLEVLPSKEHPGIV